MTGLTRSRCLLAGIFAVLFFATSSVAQNTRPPITFRDAVGSWFGRALAVPGRTVCAPGSPGCSVPPEIIMVFTVNRDGTFIGIDSNIFTGGNHSTAHGQWTFSGEKSIRAAFTFLQSGPNDLFIGGFKNILTASVVDSEHMEGSIDAYFYQYTTPIGSVIVDNDGFPTPNPLSPPDQCAPPRCTAFGTFNFKVRRVSVPAAPTTTAPR